MTLLNIHMETQKRGNKAEGDNNNAVIEQDRLIDADEEDEFIDLYNKFSTTWGTTISWTITAVLTLTPVTWEF